jgi:hypothetical protein
MEHYNKSNDRFRNSLRAKALAAAALVLAAGAGMAGVGFVNAQTATTSTVTPTTSSINRDSPAVDNKADGETADDANQAAGETADDQNGQKNQGDHIDGNITAISGSTITLTEEANEGTAVLTVNTSGATFDKNGVASSLGSFAVGEKIFVEGTQNGTTVTATKISSGHPQRAEPANETDTETNDDGPIK